MNLPISYLLLLLGSFFFGTPCIHASNPAVNLAVLSSPETQGPHTLIIDREAQEEKKSDEPPTPLQRLQEDFEAQWEELLPLVHQLACVCSISPPLLYLLRTKNATTRCLHILSTYPADDPFLQKASKGAYCQLKSDLCEEVRAQIRYTDLLSLVDWIRTYTSNTCLTCQMQQDWHAMLPHIHRLVVYLLSEEVNEKIKCKRKQAVLQKRGLALLYYAARYSDLPQACFAPSQDLAPLVRPVHSPHSQVICQRADVLDTVDEWLAQRVRHAGIGKYGDAFKCYQKVVRESSKTLQQHAICYNNLGRLSYRKEKYATAIRMYGVALDLLERVSSTPTKADIRSKLAILTNLGGAQHTTGDVMASTQSYEQAFDIGRQVLAADDPYILRLYNALAVNALQEGNYEVANHYYYTMRDVLLLSPEAKTSDFIPIYQNIGLTYEWQGEKKRAATFFQLGRALLGLSEPEAPSHTHPTSKTEEESTWELLRWLMPLVFAFMLSPCME